MLGQGRDWALSACDGVDGPGGAVLWGASDRQMVRWDFAYMWDLGTNKAETPAGSGKHPVHSEGDRLQGATRALPTSIKTFRGSAVCGQQKCSKLQAASRGEHTLNKPGKKTMHT